MNKNNPLALCRRCRKWKPKELFSRYASGRLVPYCPDCYVSPGAASARAYKELHGSRVTLFLQGRMDCTKCGKVKLLRDFPEQCRRVGGGHTCYKCLSKYALDRYYSLPVEQRRVERRSSWASMSKDPVVKLRYLLRRRMSTALHQAMLVKTESSANIVNYIGCSIAELRAYLEAQFKPGMTWGNHGVHGWHIDHIFPLCRFNLTNENDMKKAWHYTNLRPLWAKENLRKHDKKPKNYQPSLLFRNP